MWVIVLVDVTDFQGFKVRKKIFFAFLFLILLLTVFSKVAVMFQCFGIEPILFDIISYF